MQILEFIKIMASKKCNIIIFILKKPTLKVCDLKEVIFLAIVS
jgi:hypothetical protein